MPLLRTNCAPLRPLLWLVVSMGCTADTTPESAQWGQGLEVSQPVLSAAALGPEGLIHLAIFQGGAFAFYIAGPAADVVVGKEIDLTTTPGWQVGFTAMVSGGQGMPAPDVSCKADEDEGETKGCLVPYVGYGGYTPVPEVIEAGRPNSSAQLLFHEFGEDAGDSIVVDVIYSLSRFDLDDDCQVYHRYTTAPLNFTVSETPTKVDPATTASPVVGPIFQESLNDGDGEPDPTAASPTCALDEMALTYRDSCPLPGQPEGTDQPTGIWHWYYRCLAATNQ